MLTTSQRTSESQKSITSLPKSSKSSWKAWGRRQLLYLGGNSSGGRMLKTWKNLSLRISLLWVKTSSLQAPHGPVLALPGSITRTRSRDIFRSSRSSKASGRSTRGLASSNSRNQTWTMLPSSKASWGCLGSPRFARTTKLWRRLEVISRKRWSTRSSRTSSPSSRKLRAWRHNWKTWKLSRMNLTWIPCDRALRKARTTKGTSLYHHTGLTSILRRQGRA